MNASTRLNGIGEYYFSQKLREIARLNSEGKNIINLGIGSPDLPPHPDVIRVLQQESAKPGTHAYQGYKGVPQIRNAFAQWYKQWYGVSLDADTEILPLIGSKEGIMHICMAFLNPGDNVLIPDPGYPTYSSAVKLAGGSPLPYLLTAENGWKPDFSSLQQQIDNGLQVKLMFVNYPHMPTGQLPDKQLFENIVAFAKKNGILVCHDNPYSFILNSNPMSLLAVDGAKEVVIELNSLSKSHNMAGWRVGVLCGSSDKIDVVLRFKSNMDSGMFLPIQMAAVQALQLGREWHEQLNTIYARRKMLVIQLLNNIGCIPTGEQAGMFVWAAVPDTYKDGYALSDDILYNSNVFITPGGIFGSAGEKYIRVSLCSSEENLKHAIERVQKIHA